MSATRCGTCGAVDVPWSRGHAPHCEKYRPPRSARLCEVCGYPAAVRYVKTSAPVEVEFECRRGCDVSWVEVAAGDDDGEVAP